MILKEINPFFAMKKYKSNILLKYLSFLIKKILFNFSIVILLAY